ncbi:MAG TPA: MFS transporter [Actinomycetaceae bacterium]|nr:MFS transporter [Actinomycetaceae bacterium]
MTNRSSRSADDRRNPIFGLNRRTPEELAEHRQIMRVFTGLLLALFVAMLSGTIVGNALPVIMAELGGTQLEYTWIVSAALLASTASTPIFGKLADLFDKRKLLFLSLSIFAVGSLLAGLATSASALIFFRVLQGIGMGSQMALVQTTIATIIPPRARGRYNGYMGAVMAVATVSGPLIGGLIVDTPWLGWRWTYWSAIPFTLIAIFVLHRRLDVPRQPRKKPKIDYWGAALIVLSVTLLLLWLSFAGSAFAWASWQTAVMVSGTVIGIIAFVLVELRHPEPVVPMWILTDRTTALSIVASFSVGTIMFGSPLFLGQYFQVGRGYAPAAAGLLATPLMIGVFLASTIAGRLVTRRGTWKRYVVGGISIQAVGVLLMSTVGADTPLPLVSAFLLLVGLGQGASMQNLVLAVQNSVRLSHMGVASSTVTFFRSLGGATGVQVLGAIFTMQLHNLITRRLTDAGLPPPEDGQNFDSLDFTTLSPAVEDIVRRSYGDGLSVVFGGMAILAVIALIATTLMRNSFLRSTVDIEDPAERARAEERAKGGTTRPAAETIRPAPGNERPEPANKRPAPETKRPAPGNNGERASENGEPLGVERAAAAGAGDAGTEPGEGAAVRGDAVTGDAGMPDPVRHPGEVSRADEAAGAGEPGAVDGDAREGERRTESDSRP